MLWNGAVSAAPGRDLAHLTPGKVCKAPAKLFTFPDKADRLLYNHLRFHHFLPLATRNIIKAQTPKRGAGEGGKIQIH